MMLHSSPFARVAIAALAAALVVSGCEEDKRPIANFCSSGADCPTGQVCLDGFCGFACQSDAECPDDLLCEDSICVPPCEADEECPLALSGRWACLEGRCDPEPAPTVAVAGQPRTVDEGDLVVLDALAESSLVAPELATIVWEQVDSVPDGVQVSLELAGKADSLQAAAVQFKAPVVFQQTILTFRLAIDDGRGGLSDDMVEITIRNSANEPPVAVLPESPTDPVEGGATIVVSAAESSDPNPDTAFAYTWTIEVVEGEFTDAIAFEDASEEGASAPFESISFVAPYSPSPMRLRVTVTVSDGQASASASIEYDVLATTGCVPAMCDDDDPCTKDECDEADECTYSPDSGAACDDGDPCTTDDVCVEGSCEGTPVDCPEDGPCWDAYCGSTGECESTPAEMGAACDDGDPCTTDDLCSDGECVGTPVVCNATSECEVAACGAEGSCESSPASFGLGCAGAYGLCDGSGTCQTSSPKKILLNPLFGEMDFVAGEFRGLVEWEGQLWGFGDAGYGGFSEGPFIEVYAGMLLPVAPQVMPELDMMPPSPLTSVAGFEGGWAATDTDNQVYTYEPNWFEGWGSDEYLSYALDSSNLIHRVVAMPTDSNGDHRVALLAEGAQGPALGFCTRYAGDGVYWNCDTPWDAPPVEFRWAHFYYDNGEGEAPSSGVALSDPISVTPAAGFAPVSTEHSMIWHSVEPAAGLWDSTSSAGCTIDAAPCNAVDEWAGLATGLAPEELWALGHYGGLVHNGGGGWESIGLGGAVGISETSFEGRALVAAGGYVWMVGRTESGFVECAGNDCAIKQQASLETRAVVLLGYDVANGVWLPARQLDGASCDPQESEGCSFELDDLDVTGIGNHSGVLTIVGRRPSQDAFNYYRQPIVYYFPWAPFAN